MAKARPTPTQGERAEFRAICLDATADELRRLWRDAQHRHPSFVMEARRIADARGVRLNGDDR